jgi:hypothetical protein
MKLLLPLLFILLVVGCYSQKKTTTKEVVITRDSVIYIYKDSFCIRIKDSTRVHDSVVIKGKSKGSIQMPCKENYQQTFEQDGNTFLVKVIDGIVKLEYELSGTISKFQTAFALKEKEINQLKHDVEVKDRNDIKTSEEQRVKEKFSIRWIVPCLIIGFILGIIVKWKFI